MGHNLHAVIGPQKTVAEFASRWLVRFVDLPQEFAILPLTPSLYDNIVELIDLQKPEPFPGFERLSASVAYALEYESAHGLIGYLETNYLGGVGQQRAIGWRKGTLSIGPLFSETTWTDNGLQSDAPVDRAINQVLTSFRIWTRGNADPFEMLELGKYRDTDRLAERLK